ncbi:DUF6221 family protein [Planobispora rosea]|uniref:DUF6221 family protein n=1 Tax=Planobispora rosea TaxID=35762 RepID=UPI00083A1F9E|nr:DUF6221 family protein [Planobispora rosea]
MASDDLIAFLNARLAEDEQAARDADAISRDALLDLYEDLIKSRPLDDARRAFGIHIARFTPGRMLVDVTAKRMILKEHRPASDEYPGSADRGCMGCGLNGDEEFATPDVDWCPVLCALALPYAAHHEYRQEWKP